MNLTRAAVALCAVTLVAGCSVSATDTASPSSTRSAATPASPTAPSASSQQLTWLLGALDRLPVSNSEISSHVEPSYLAQFGGIAGFRSALGRKRQLTIDHRTDLAVSARAVVTDSTAPGRALITVATDPRGLVDFVSSDPYAETPARSFDELDRAAQQLAPRVSMTVARIASDGETTPIHSLDGTTPRPLGSEFKLYVLGTLLDEIRRGAIHWDDTVPLHEEWRATASPLLGTVPAGTPLSYRRLATAMIFASDNTAADHLIHLLGRDRVQSMQGRMGMTDPGRNVPFLTTKEAFTLKTVDYPGSAQEFVASDPARRAQLLSQVDMVPLSAIYDYPTPRSIDDIEWFASTDDITRAHASLLGTSANPATAGVDRIMSLNDLGLGLDRTAYPRVWFKGGEENGVLTSSWTVTRADGQSVAIALALSSTTAPLDKSRALELMPALARSALELAQR